MSLEEKNSLLAEVIRAKEEEKQEAERIKIWEIPLILVLLPLCLAAKFIRLSVLLIMCVVCSIFQTVALIYILGKR